MEFGHHRGRQQRRGPLHLRRRAVPAARRRSGAAARRCDAPARASTTSRASTRPTRALAQYLSPARAPSCDYTDLWWNPAESGWGLNIVQHPTRNIFARLVHLRRRRQARPGTCCPAARGPRPTCTAGTLYADHRARPYNARLRSGPREQRRRSAPRRSPSPTPTTARFALLGERRLRQQVDHAPAVLSA